MSSIEFVVVVVERARHYQLARCPKLLSVSPLSAPVPVPLPALPVPFRDQIALELSKGAEDVEDQLASRCGRVDLFGQALEANPPLTEHGERLD